MDPEAEPVVSRRVSESSDLSWCTQVGCLAWVLPQQSNCPYWKSTKLLYPSSSFTEGGQHMDHDGATVAASRTLGPSGPKTHTHGRMRVARKADVFFFDHATAFEFCAQTMCSHGPAAGPASP